jgi:hypothetical protein
MTKENERNNNPEIAELSDVDADKLAIESLDQFMEEQEIEKIEKHLQRIKDAIEKKNNTAVAAALIKFSQYLEQQYTNTLSSEAIVKKLQKLDLKLQKFSADPTYITAPLSEVVGLERSKLDELLDEKGLAYEQIKKGLEVFEKFVDRSKPFEKNTVNYGAMKGLIKQINEGFHNNTVDRKLVSEWIEQTKKENTEQGEIKDVVDKFNKALQVELEGLLKSFDEKTLFNNEISRTASTKFENCLSQIEDKEIIKKLNEKKIEIVNAVGSGEKTVTEVREKLKILRDNVRSEKNAMEAVGALEDMVLSAMSGLYENFKKIDYDFYTETASYLSAFKKDLQKSVEMLNKQDSDIKKLREKFEQRWNEIDVHIEKLKGIAFNAEKGQDAEKIIIAKMKYIALESHVTTLKQQVNDLCDKPTSEKAERLEKTYDTMCRDPKLQVRRHPEVDAIVDSAIELIGGLLRFAVGLLSWGVSETNYNAGKKITAFFTPKSTSTKKVEKLGDLVKQATQITKNPNSP